MGKVIVTGGAGFIGSHVAEHYARKGYEVVVIDNLSRASLLGRNESNASHNWNYLTLNYKNIRLVKGDVRDLHLLEDLCRNTDIIIHTAAQTSVPMSISNPMDDFSINVVGTFNILETVRKLGTKPAIIYCSTNKVYGENVNEIPVVGVGIRYRFENKFGYEQGIPRNFGVDLCEHTPYGCSKLVGDLYMQEYARLYGMKIGVFRMSCIYGPRQFGVEEQGWMAWFTIATILNKPIVIYGDGRQVRDVLYVTDLIEAYDAFVRSDIQHGVFNIGGGPKKTLSLLEAINLLQKLTDKRISNIKFSDWRTSDQKVYISDISRVEEELNWSPKVTPLEGMKKLVQWVEENKMIF